jgi:cation diffusion facilitator family transporter
MVSVYSNTGLVVAKLTVGLATGALSVVGEALHSASDLLAALIALAAVRVSSRPADEEHPYGHGKYEHVSAGIEGLILLVAAAWIMYEAVDRVLFHKQVDIFAAPGMAVMLAGVVVNTLVSQFLMVLSRRHRSPALEADGIHLRADVWTSGAVLVGLGCIHFGAPMWVDSLLAVIVAAMVAYEGIRLSLGAVKDLVDTALPRDERDIIGATLAEYNGPYVGYHKLRARRTGRKRQADVHVVVCQQLTVGEAHDITEKLKTAVGTALPGTDLVVHVEPCEDEDCLALLRKGEHPLCKRRIEQEEQENLE